MTNIDFDRGTRFGELFDALRDIAPAQAVDRFDSISASVFHDQFAHVSRPFILKLPSTSHDQGTCVEWLNENFGSLQIKVRYGDYATPKNYAPEKRILKDMCLSDYIKSVSIPSSHTPPYAGNFSLPENFLSQIGAGVPSYYPSNAFEAPTVWLGASGCITPLHRDSSDNFAYHLAGKKRWTIFPPHDAPYLYMTSVSASKGGDFATSAVDLRNPDLIEFALFSQAHPLRVTVDAGEMLYIPMGWSHFVENLDVSLMVNYWLSVTPIGIAALLGR